MSATQQIPGDPVAPVSPNQAKRSNPLGLAALIVGGVALIASVVPLVNYVSGIVAVAGLVLGIVAWTFKGRKKLLAILGTLVSVLALVSSIVLASLYTAGLADAVGGLVSSAASDASEVTIGYEVTGEAGANATIGYSTFIEGTSTNEEVSDTPLPFTHEVTVSSGGDDARSYFTLTAIPTELGTPLTCTITIDGEVVDTGSGASTCSATYVLDSRD
jgi:hypothetical protein